MSPFVFIHNSLLSVTDHH